MLISGKIVGRESCDDNLYAYRVLLDAPVLDPNGETLPMGERVTIEIPIGTAVSVTVPEQKTVGQLAFEAAAGALTPATERDRWEKLPDETKQLWQSSAVAVSSAVTGLGTSRIK